ncbi:reverse transcriptase [Senna tora]|uniref:Reverse transcriptase n=1 Tax=Senna tora TaxID=362788 RepID=A0A834WER3_9FABA|nr:reverse transcriptase [Senna tora]
METRNSERKMEVWRRGKFKFSEAFYVNPEGLSGGLALWWSSEVKLEVLFASKNVIHVFVKEGWGSFSGFISFVYGPPVDKDKERFWNFMRQLQPPGGHCWICLGDLNELVGQSEKLGGRINSSRRFFNLQSFLFDCELIDMGFKGVRFTWSNGQLDWRHVKERLDRAVCNFSFRSKFQKAQVIHLDRVGSDHCPLLLCLEYCETRTPRSFKFEMNWCEHPGLLEVVDKVWQPFVEADNCMPDFLVDNLDAVRVALTKWSKTEFPNNAKQIEKLLKELNEGDEDVLSDSIRDNSSLCKPVSVEEVKAAAFELGGLKAPGPDGFSGIFYHHSWCIRSVRYKLLLSGRQVAEVRPARGIRQGDPLSPYLFILAAYVLSRMVTFHASAGDLKGIKLARSCPPLTHCFFADDSIFFFQADFGSCEKMKWILDAYCQASGQLANLDKSCLFFSPNTPDELKAEIVNSLGISHAAHPGKYLGLPVVWGKSKDEALAFVRDKLIKKIQGWKHSLLSHAGREVLIKAVANAIPAFPMSCFKFPKKTCDALDRAIAKFWWGQKKEEGKIHWLAWSKLIKSKHEGGMGFREFSCFNDAMLAKQGWRILMEPNELWVKILKGVYFPNDDFLTAKKGARASWAWSSILEGRTLLLKGLCWSVGDGASIDAWKDPWIPGAFDCKPRPRPLLAAGFDLKVKDLICKGRWVLDSVKRWFCDEDCGRILSIPISVTSRADKLLWSPNRSGSFSVKTGYKLAIGSKKEVVQLKPSSSFSVPDHLWSDIWSLKICPKVKHFMWRVCWNALSTRENLFRRKCSPSPVCPICLSEPESIEHLLFFCGWTRSVWFSCSLASKVDRFSISRVEDWCGRFFGKSSPLTQNLQALAACICWCIWKERCSFCFEGKPVDPSRVAAAASDLLNAFLLASEKGIGSAELPVYPSLHVPQWSPPSEGQVKVNIDGAFLPPNSAGVGIIFRNSAGLVLEGCCLACPASSSFMSEALALRKALQMARVLNFVSLVVDSDCKPLVDAVELLSSSPDWLCASILDDVLVLKKAFGSFLVRWIPRSQNLAADWLANAAIRGCAPLVGCLHPHPLASLLLEDSRAARQGVG